MHLINYTFAQQLCSYLHFQLLRRSTNKPPEICSLLILAKNKDLCIPFSLILVDFLSYQPVQENSFVLLF